MTMTAEKAVATRVDIQVHDGDWIATEDGSCLFATIWVNGCPMHLEAHAVRQETDVEDSVAQVNDGQDSTYEELHNVFGCYEPLETVTIRGREYVLFAQAYGR